MLYTYRTLIDNKITKGEMEAGSIAEVTEFLKKNGSFPIEVTEKKTTSSFFISHFVERVTYDDIAYLTRQLAIMLNAGLTLIDALELLVRQTKKTPMKKMLQDIDKSLREGKTFSNALEGYKHYFSRFYIALVRSGEASGKLDLIMSKVADHLDREHEFRGKIRNALVYPTVIVIAMISMMFIMVTFVMPKILQLYENFQVDLPASTLFALSVSTFMSKYWPLVLAFIGACIFALKKYFDTVRGRKLLEERLMNLPIVGDVIVTSGLVEVARTLSILISSGVPILDGLAIVTQINTYVLFREAFHRVTERVEKGFSIGNAMANEPIFPPSLVQMTIVGEQTGHLDETLNRIADYYQQESETNIKSMLTLIDPIILIFLGICVGILVFAVLSPIFNLTGAIQ